MSPSAAAIAIGLKKSNVTYWKNGRNNPSDVTLAKIANFFGVTVEELMIDDPSVGIKKETTELLDDLKNFSVLYKKLTEENKKKADEYIALLLGSQK